MLQSGESEEAGRAAGRAHRVSRSSSGARLRARFGVRRCRTEGREHARIPWESSQALTPNSTQNAAATKPRPSSAVEAALLAAPFVWLALGAEDDALPEGELPPAEAEVFGELPALAVVFMLSAAVTSMGNLMGLPPAFMSTLPSASMTESKLLEP